MIYRNKFKKIAHLLQINILFSRNNQEESKIFQNLSNANKQHP